MSGGPGRRMPVKLLAGLGCLYYYCIESLPVTLPLKFCELKGLLLNRDWVVAGSPVLHDAALESDMLE